jgi:hypothetical protein
MHALGVSRADALTRARHEFPHLFAQLTTHDRREQTELMIRQYCTTHGLDVETPADYVRAYHALKSDAVFKDACWRS